MNKIKYEMCIRELIVIVIILHFRYMRSGLVGKKRTTMYM